MVIAAALLSLSSLLAGSRLPVDEGDETLRYYLSRSAVVIAGEIMSEPVGIFDEEGVANWSCEVRVEDVVKGPALGGRAVPVNVVRFHREAGDRPSFLEQGGRCVLFLREAVEGAQPGLATADMWFGAQPHSPWLVRALKRLAAGDKKVQKPVRYAGRETFQPMHPDLPALRALRAPDLDGVQRYDIPLYAVGAKRGQVLADVGCSSGVHAVRLARRVGEEGRVYCRDIDPVVLENLRKRMKRDRVPNLDVALSEKGDVKLPASSIDVALLADVYHFVITQEETKESFVRTLFEAMKPGGVVVLTFLRTAQLFDEEKWRATLRTTVVDFTRGGFEAGRRLVLEEEPRPILVLEFRRPLE